MLRFPRTRRLQSRTPAPLSEARSRTCELQTLEEAELENCDVAIAASGDDKVNLVHSLLAKTEFGVPRTVARINHPGNEWLFDEAWGVDVAVSTPRIMSALVEEAVATGDLVRLFTFTKSTTNLSEIRLPRQSPFVMIFGRSYVVSLAQSAAKKISSGETATYTEIVRHLGTN